MIPIYGSLATILLCTFFPPVIDRFQSRGIDWRWSRSIAGYGAMTAIVLLLSFFLPGANRYLDLLLVIPAVAVANLLVPITYAGTFFVIFMSRVVWVIAILWEISRYNHVPEPFKIMLHSIEWHIFILPLMLGLATLAAMRYLAQLWSNKKQLERERICG